MNRTKREWKLWYRQPAVEWEEALPIGNGRIGGMVFGGIDVERIALNEDTLWAGFPRDTVNYEARRYLSKARELVFAGRSKEAQQIVEDRMLGPNCEPYLPFGDLMITNAGDQQERTASYQRELELTEGLAGVFYRSDERTAVRGQYFASVPDQVLVVRYEAQGEGSLNVDVTLTSPLRYETQAENDAVLIMRGRAPSHIIQSDDGDHPEPVLYESGLGTPFEARLLVETDGQTVAVGEGSIGIRYAKAYTLYIALETGYVDYRTMPTTEGLEQRNRQRVEKAAELGFEKLLKRHRDDHRSLFDRVDLRLAADNDNGAAKNDQPTDERLAAYREGGTDVDLEALYFQYGRYLLMACSRPGTQAANLQGIWNPLVQPPWNSDYTVNINTEMNYWLAEVGNLSECHEPLFDLLDDLSETGSRAARILYGCRGWTVHHNVDVWRMATPTSGSAGWAFWPMGGAWMARHLWDRFLFNGDRRFLGERAYPLMKGAALFCLDWLVEGPNGLLVTNPSTSPENTYITAEGERCNITVASTMDIAIIREVLTFSAESARLLEVDPSLRAEWEAAASRLPAYRIGRHGGIQEWLDDHEEWEPGHRHSSHLYGLHPGTEIHEGTPELLQAAATTLERRLANGGGHTGWSCAWLINQFARLKDAEQAYDNVRTLLSRSTYPNLFDAHPPFQIDGNFGGPAGMAELLLQSHLGYIELLPALPAAWSEGAVDGLKARGGVTVSMKWEKGKLTEVELEASIDGEIHLRYTGAEWSVVDEQAIAVDCSEGSFWVQAGNKYRLVLPRPSDAILD
ncbi:glycoside hydrolase N-terminal domain-containing protein [Cohnella sp. WQ 127256]|uniref:glycoside hydrolase family 95 protein n=1 Tax=Cohnella sp. WQ 127256 TaxID=2938790 RepID=UPI0021173AB3|nr:glycoside hydrolase family 95 protein [Cohnella sp. WQ 127256]